MNTTPSPSLAIRPLPNTAPRRHLLRLGLATTLLSLALAGCGGGTSDDAPTVVLASTDSSASAGETITLIAVPSSDLGISAVRFYRVDSGASTLLGTVNASPYQFTTTIPSTATDSVSYFARAVDADGNTGDSDDVDIAITD